jgi:hypothetical protein
MEVRWRVSAALLHFETKVELHAPQLRQVSTLCPKLRRGGGGRRNRSIYANGATTMLALGLVLNTVGIGLFCWLIFALAVYALPFFVAVSVGIMAFHGGAGVIGALLIGIAAGAFTLAIGQTAFAIARSPIFHAAIGAVFAIPAAIAGYHVLFAMSQIGVPSLAWREVFACLGAVFIGGTAWARLTVLSEPRPLEPDRVERSTPQAVFTAAARDG